VTIIKTYKGGRVMAENVKITIQTGLNEVADYLRENGYDVCVMGNCKGGADISIVDVPDSDWERWALPNAGLTEKMKCS
jgi:Uncharacterised protein family (UPF0180).